MQLTGLLSLFRQIIFKPETGAWKGARFVNPIVASVPNLLEATKLSIGQWLYHGIEYLQLYTCSKKWLWTSMLMKMNFNFLSMMIKTDGVACSLHTWSEVLLLASLCT